MARFSLILAIFVAALAAMLSLARAQEPGFETKAQYAILIDARSGNVFFEKNADVPVPPASMSKLMTMIMVFEGLKDGKLKMDQEFLISEDAWRRGGSVSGGSTMYAELNSRVRLSDLMQGVIVQSANDACIAIAEGIAGSEAAFAARMTKRARELGLEKAEFRNATGLPDPEHKMSVRELATLARYINLNFPEYYKYYSQPDFHLEQDHPAEPQSAAQGLSRRRRHEDRLYSGMRATASSARPLRDGRRLIMVVAGLASLNERKQEAQKLLDWGFSQFKHRRGLCGGRYGEPGTHLGRR